MKDSNETINDVQTAIAAGAALGDPHQIESKGLYAVIPHGYRLESLEPFQDRPARVRQEIRLMECDSFIEYIKQFRTPATRIFFNAETETFTAILDYHAEAPGWCDHEAAYECQRTEEFKTWLASNRKQMDQVAFARFLEENLSDIVEPAGAELLEIALTLQAKKEVNFSSGVRLSSGQVQFTYDEIVRGNSSRNTLAVPEQFTLGIPIHVGGPAYRIPVRLRWRLTEGKVVFWYEVVRPHKFIADALAQIRIQIAEDTGISVLAGIAK
jgi:uncharacterized protein YfdQ (DUF2303 family)